MLCLPFPDPPTPPPSPSPTPPIHPHTRGEWRDPRTAHTIPLHAHLLRMPLSPSLRSSPSPPPTNTYTSVCNTCLCLSSNKKKQQKGSSRATRLASLWYPSPQNYGLSLFFFVWKAPPKHPNKNTTTIPRLPLPHGSTTDAHLPHTLQPPPNPFPSLPCCR